MADDDQPKKYIRTFAGDMKTLHEGGTPDLTPLAEPSSRERLVAASPIAPIPAPVQTPEPLPTAQPVPVFKAPETAPIKTYEGDFSNRMKEGNASFATVLAAEQDLGPSGEVIVKKKISRSSIIYSIAGAIFLIAGIMGAYTAYTHYLAAVTPVIPTATISAPIFVDERQQISGTGSALAQAIGQSVDHLLTSGNVRLLYLASTTAADTSVLSALHTSAPDVLLRNIDTTNSMAGIVNVSGTQSPFFILSVTAYSDTFAGMLSWEHLMLRDFSVLFPAYAISASNAQVATSTPSVSVDSAAFHDEVVSNHDVRVYRDAAGKSLFLYGYWNQSTLIIARDPAAFTEIVQRLATSRTQS